MPGRQPPPLALSTLVHRVDNLESSMRNAQEWLQVISCRVPRMEVFPSLAKPDTGLPRPVGPLMPKFFNFSLVGF